MSVLDFMKTPKGKIIVSVILAVGLASLLKSSLNNNMIVLNGPSLEQTEGKIFSFDDKCYSYKTVATSCDNLADNEKHLEKV